MPEKAKPRVRVPAPPTHVHTAGKQEDFQEAGVSLAAALGWEGAPDDELRDIDVADAQRFITRTLHDHYIAGAKGDDQPDPMREHGPVEHLSLDEGTEVAALVAALSKVYEAGKSAQVTEHPIVNADLGKVHFIDPKLTKEG